MRPDQEATLETSLEQARATKDHVAEAELLALLGAGHMRSGRFDWATEAFIEAAELWRVLGERGRHLAALSNVAVSLMRRGDLDAACDAAAAANSDDEACDLYRAARTVNLGVLAVQAGETSRALDLFDRAFACARTVDDDTVKAAALNNAALAYILDRDRVAASGLLERAGLLAQRTLDSVGRARVYNNIGVTHFHAGRMFEAIPYFELALSMAEGSDDHTVIVEILNNNVLAFEHHYLEPATRFRSDLKRAVAAHDLHRAERLSDLGAIALPAESVLEGDEAGAHLSAEGGDVLSLPRSLLWPAIS